MDKVVELVETNRDIRDAIEMFVDNVEGGMKSYPSYIDQIEPYDNLSFDVFNTGDKMGFIALDGVKCAYSSFPNSIQYIKFIGTDLSYAMSDCKTVTEFRLYVNGNLNMSHSFENCSRLLGVTLMGDAIVVNPTDMFYGCTQIGRIEGLRLGEFTGSVKKWNIPRTVGIDSDRRILRDLQTITKEQTISVDSEKFSKLSQSEIADVTNKGWTITSY